MWGHVTRTILQALASANMLADQNQVLWIPCWYVAVVHVSSHHDPSSTSVPLWHKQGGGLRVQEVWEGWCNPRKWCNKSGSRKLTGAPYLVVKHHHIARVSIEPRVNRFAHATDLVQGWCVKVRPAKFQDLMEIEPESQALSRTTC